MVPFATWTASSLHPFSSWFLFTYPCLLSPCCRTIWTFSVISLLQKHSAEVRGAVAGQAEAWSTVHLAEPSPRRTQSGSTAAAALHLNEAPVESRGS